MWIIIAGFVAAAVACLGAYWYICPEKHRTAHSGRARGIRDDSDGTYERFLLFDHLFQMVQWADDEPWKIEDLLMLPEKEEQNEN